MDGDGRRAAPEAPGVAGSANSFQKQCLGYRMLITFDTLAIVCLLRSNFELCLRMLFTFDTSARILIAFVLYLFTLRELFGEDIFHKARTRGGGRLGPDSIPRLYPRLYPRLRMLFTFDTLAVVCLLR